MIKTFLTLLGLCLSLCSFNIPKHTDFLKMNIEERESLIKSMWDHRQEIIKDVHQIKYQGSASKALQLKAKEDFFEFFHQMLILDRDLERQSKSKKR